jgi:hypothetical protein
MPRRGRLRAARKTPLREPPPEQSLDCSSARPIS